MHIGVFGAGAIGCFVGLRLSAAGERVTLLGRASLVAAEGSLHAVPITGPPARPGADLTVTQDPADLADVDVCLVTVKSRDTEDAGRALAEVLRPDALVVSLQNGLSNPPTLRKALPGDASERVIAAMISYNVFRDDDHAYRQATTGPIVAERGRGRGAETMRRLAEAMRKAGDEVELSDDMPSVAAGKLLLNLNNGICAATGLTIAESLRSRDARWCFAACMREGLRVMKAAGVTPAKVVALPPSIIARMLGLPNFIVLAVARKMVQVDPRARSSTLQDVLAGKPTEIDDLCGAVVALAKTAGVPAPKNAALVEIVHGLEGKTPPPFVSAAALRARLATAT